MLLLFLSLLTLQTTDAYCIRTPPDSNEVCRGWWEAPTCDSGYERIKYGGCSCRWGFCAKSYYRCMGIPTCCDGWTGGSCNIPICSGGCNSGTCVSPESCQCPDGYSGNNCETAPSPSADELTVMTLNFACRDIAPFSACDNCQTRFDLLAEAFADSSGFDGIPDLTAVDVILGQELATEQENFAQITSALENLGFHYTTGGPSPELHDHTCDDPLLFGTDGRQVGSSLSGLESGGLVTWSKYPIVYTHKQNWCAHSLPVPSGYLLTLLDVGDGRAVAVINLHAMTEEDFGLQDSAEDVRTYQFGEVSGLARTLTDSFHEDSISFSVILGGDFNEDAYSRNSQSPSPNCELITSTLVQQKFSSVGLDIQDACNSNRIGHPTWDTANNDLAQRFSSSSTNQVLDYLLEYSSSHSGDNTPVNTVSVLKSNAAWNGVFCDDSIFPGNTSPGTAYALSDHNTVTATFQLPQGTTTATIDDALDAFQNAITRWINDKVADDAACGQETTFCFSDADCCSVDYSWTSEGQHCNGIFCEACSELNGPCGTQVVGSECCGYNDYTSGWGTHCEVWVDGGPKCIRKFEAGESCLFHEECQSNNCNWLFRCD